MSAPDGEAVLGHGLALQSVLYRLEALFHVALEAGEDQPPVVVAVTNLLTITKDSEADSAGLILAPRWLSRGFGHGRETGRRTKP